MTTDRQKDLATAIMKNQMLPRDKRKNRGELVGSVGYSPSTSKKKPTKVIEAKGVKDELKKAGLTEELITESLVYDIENKPKKRVKELSLGADILGMKKNETGGNKTLILVISGESAIRYGISTNKDTEESSS